MGKTHSVPRLQTRDMFNGDGQDLRMAPAALSGGQHTALILKFNCLFTHDMTRKQKRWHDGTLCFHTFNKRIMVSGLSTTLIFGMKR